MKTTRFYLVPVVVFPIVFALAYLLTCLTPHGHDPNLIEDFGADPTGVVAADTAFAHALATVGSGQIVVPKGTYTITSTIKITHDNVAILMSKGTTLKKVGTNFDVIAITGNYCEVSGGEINGNYQAQGSGILITGSHNFVHNISIRNVGDVTNHAEYAHGSHGICLDGQKTVCSFNHLESLVVTASHDVGIAQNMATDTFVNDVEVTNNGLEGITVDNAAHRFRASQARLDNNCLLGGAGGISIDGSDFGTLTAVYVSHSNQPGIITNNNLAASNYWTVTGSQLLGNVTYGIYLRNNEGRTANGWAVTGNVLLGNTAGTVKIDQGSSNNQVRANSLNEAVSDSGSNNTVN